MTQWNYRVPAAALACVLTLSVTPALAQTPQAASRAPRHIIIGIDRSGSRTAQQFADMRVFIESLAEGLDFGERLTVTEIPQTPFESVKEFMDSIPSLRRPPTISQREQRFREALRSSLKSAGAHFTDSTGARSIVSTDILTFLRRVADYSSRAPKHRTIIVLLSDMIHDTPTLRLTRVGSVPDDDWIAQQAAEGLIPSLRDVCIVAVGVDAGSPRAVRVKRFWTSYLKAAGAVLEENHYRGSMHPQAITC